MCYTNRVLDAFLESMLAATKSIVRIGSRSSSILLQNHTLTGLKKYAHENKAREKSLYEAEAMLRGQVATTINDLNDLIAQSEQGQCFLEPHEKVQTLNRKIEDLQAIESSSLLKNADIVGVTSTGAAKNRKLLDFWQLCCRIFLFSSPVFRWLVSCSIPNLQSKKIPMGKITGLEPDAFFFFFLRHTNWGTFRVFEA